MSFRSLHIENHLYFITATIAGWNKLFLDEKYILIILNSLKWLRENNRIKLFAFVIMPHHLHFICIPLNGYQIGEIIQNFGSFTAHKFLATMRQDGEIKLLTYIKDAATKTKLKVNHHFWEIIQAKNIFSLEVLKQKLEYIHNNPIAKDWDLAANRYDYIYSSACFYDKGTKPIIEIDDVSSIMT